MQPISLYIVDPHDFFRRGIIATLSETEDLSFTGESGTADNLAENPALARTDVLLLDICLTDKASAELIRRLNSRYPDLKIIIIAFQDKPFLLKNAINLGIPGYVLKDSSPEILKQAIMNVYTGRKFLDPNLSETIFNIISKGKFLNEQDTLYSSLSRREQEIFRMLADGQTIMEIADNLFLSSKTVSNYRSTILSKLNLGTSSKLAVFAKNLGII